MASSRTASGALALLLAVAGVVAGDHFLPPHTPVAAAPTAPETRALTSATVVCPDADEAAGTTRSTRISYASEGTGGAVTAHWLAAGAGETTSTGAPMTQALPVQPDNFGGVVLSAVGPAATGFTAQITSTYDTTPAAGSAPAAGKAATSPATGGSARLGCLTPTSEAYFAGPATTVGHDPRLVLINPDPTPANVDVSVAENGKPFSRENTRGVALAGYGRTSIALVDVAPEQAAVAVHVVTRSGRVTAAVRDRWFTGSVPQGIDWLAAGSAPAKDIVLPGVGGPASVVSLVLASTSSDAGSVVVQALNVDGAFTPAGLQSIDVPPGAIVRLTVPKSAFPTAGALHITSDVPLLAAASTARPGSGTVPNPHADFAWTAAQAPLTAAAPAPAGQQLVLTSQTDTSVTISAPAGGSAPTATVQVAAGSAAVFPLTGYPDGAVVAPRDPGVLRAAVLDYPLGGGGAVTMLALVAPPRTVVLLPARPDISLGAH